MAQSISSSSLVRRLMPQAPERALPRRPLSKRPLLKRPLLKRPLLKRPSSKRPSFKLTPLKLAGAPVLALFSACNPMQPVPFVDAGPALPVVENPWAPGQSRRASSVVNARGLVEMKGLIHAHSYYSSDACDGEPVDETGIRNEQCYLDFRAGVCESEQDFVMLTDHQESFRDTEFPDAVLYRESFGDVVVNRDGKDIASWLSCGSEQPPTLILGGSESGAFMFVGTEGHPAPPGAEREAIYGERTQAAADALRANGAVILVPHTEDFTVDELVDLPLDGFEMYNLHANTLQNVTAILDLFLRIQEGFDGFPQSDLSLLRIYTEDPRYLDTWSQVLNRGVKRVTTMGTDCHRNTFPGLLPDGERMDSYRRMMAWFSNHLLVQPDEDGTVDDRHLKDALRSGRLFGVFELMGQAVGFDYIARDSNAVYEMGSDAPFSEGLELNLALPSVMDLPNDVERPEVTLRLLRATDAGWVEVATSLDAPLTFTPTEAGVYRAEVRLLPYHLRNDLGDDDLFVLRESRVWIYSNPIYVR